MKIVSTAAKAALEQGEVISSARVEFLATAPVRLWAGFGTRTFDGADFAGAGNTLFVKETGGALGTAAQGLQISLSGVDPAVLDLLDMPSARGARAVFRRCLFDSAGVALLVDDVHLRGRLDRLVRTDTPGGSSKIAAYIENSARTLGRASGRMRTDADQRLILAADTAFKRVSYAGSITLYLGGKPPTQVQNTVSSLSSLFSNGAPALDQVAALARKN